MQLARGLSMLRVGIRDRSNSDSEMAEPHYLYMTLTPVAPPGPGPGLSRLFLAVIHRPWSPWRPVCEHVERMLMA